MQPMFHLTEEPWIRVRTLRGETREVSLEDALLYAPDYAALAGETPAQDAAVFRLLLAVLHTVFGRVDETGAPGAVTDQEEAIGRWEALWDGETFPPEPIRAYFAQWSDRFWLFHPEHPFYQVKEAKRATSYGTFKLIGDLLESNNKPRLFPGRSGESKTRLNFAESARWLLYLNSWDDTSLKKTRGKNIAESASVGWLGKLGYVELRGRNLFESLMLNLVFLENGKKLWDPHACVPAWELDSPRISELSPIPIPKHPAALLTVQFRRIFLLRDGDAVTGYHLFSGDLLEDKNAFAEQQTIWCCFEDKKTGQTTFRPKQHGPSRQLWREFGSIAVPDGEGIPGVVQWFRRLQDCRLENGRSLLDEDWLLTISSVALTYDDTASHTVKDSFSDQIGFHASLLTDLGEEHRKNAITEIQNCESVSRYLGDLVSDLCKAVGMTEDSRDCIKRREHRKRLAREQLFARLDMPFRSWLYSLSARQNSEERARAVNEWRTTAKAIALTLGEELVHQAGQTAFIGRHCKEKRKGNGRKSVEVECRYCAPKAYIRFRNRIQKLYTEV